MKLVLVLLAIIVCAVADDEWKPKTADELKTIKSSCMEEVHLTEEQKAQVQNYEYPNEDGVRKYIMCTAMQMGVYSTDTGYNVDRVAKQFQMYNPPGGVQKQTEDCIGNNPMDGKENDAHTYEVRKCFMESEIGQKLKAQHQKQVSQNA